MSLLPITIGDTLFLWTSDNISSAFTPREIKLMQLNLENKSKDKYAANPFGFWEAKYNSSL
jgi:hypothetical protein